MIALQVNGKQKVFKEKIDTISDLLKILSQHPDHVMVELNHQWLDKKLFNTQQIKKNDCIEIVQFVGGG